MYQFMMDILINKEFDNYMMDKIVDWDIALLDGILTENGKYPIDTSRIDEELKILRKVNPQITIPV